jgi:hypothetical protein
MKETIFLTAKVKREEKELLGVLKKEGIECPHPSLGFFHFIYSPIEDANGNGVRLAEEAVENSIKQLRGTQANINHERIAGCGAIVDAWVNKSDEIEIVVSFFKNLFPKEYEYAVELYKRKKLFVSFELRTDKASVEVLADGTRRLHKIEWEGVGILMDVRPAYPNARALEMAMRIIEDAFNQEDKQLVYASAKDISEKWTRIGEMIEKTLVKKQEEQIVEQATDTTNLLKENSEETGGNKMDKKAQEALLAKFKEEVTKELGEEAVKDWSDEDFEKALAKKAKEEEQTKTETTEASEDEAKESKKKEEEKSSEKESESAETEKEDAEKESKEEKAEQTKVKETTNVVYEITEDSEKGTMEVKETITTTREVDGKVTKDEKVVRNTVYTQAQVDAMKADYEGKISEKETLITSKDKEIETLKEKVDFYKENAKKVAEIRAELGKYAEKLSDKDLLNEDKVENAKLKKQIAKLKNKETVDETEEVIASEEEENLETGADVNNEENESEEDLKVAKKEYMQSKIK